MERKRRSDGYREWSGQPIGNGSSIINGTTNNAGGTINLGAATPANFTGFLFSNTGGQTGTNTITNNGGALNLAGNVNFQFTGTGNTAINNFAQGNLIGTMNVGSVQATPNRQALTAPASRASPTPA